VRKESLQGRSSVVRIEVRDTGIGIPKEKQERIFLAYEQADPSVTREQGGTGLGLAIVNKLVKLMDGELGMESLEGRGSTFWFTVSLEKKSSEEFSRTTSPSPTLKDRTVLVVEDNASQSDSLVNALLSWGMNVETAGTGEEAIQAMKRSRGNAVPIELILMDYALPDMDGFKATSEIRAQLPGSPIQVILLAAAGQRGDALRCKEVGIEAYLTKPFKRSLIHNAILQVLNQTNDDPNTLITRHTLRTDTNQGETYRILLVEDNPVNQKVAMRLLEKSGHEVIAANDGVEALTHFKGSRTFDLILMDIQMPRMSGLEATSAIRDIELIEGGHIPIIALTAHAQKGDRDQCLEVGMDECLTKPVQTAKLMDMIQQVMADRKSLEPAAL
jgi:CheY-like chemotaxis protein